MSELERPPAPGRIALDVAAENEQALRGAVLSEYVFDFLEEVRLRIKTSDRYRISVAAFIDMFGEDVNLADVVGDRLVKKFVQVRSEEGYAAGTINRDLAALRQFFIHLGGETVAAAAFAGVRRPRGEGRRERALSSDEVKRLLAVADEAEDHPENVHPYGSIYRCILLTGLRPSELLSMKVRDVDTDRRILRVSSSKSRSGLREIPLGERAFSTFTYLADGRDHSEPLVRITHPSLGRAFRKHADRAKIDDVTLRDLRRTHAQSFLAASGNIQQVRDQLGHSSVTQTEHYTGSSSADSRRKAAEVAATMLGV